MQECDANVMLQRIDKGLKMNVYLVFFSEVVVRRLLRINDAPFCLSKSETNLLVFFLILEPFANLIYFIFYCDLMF